MRIDTRFIPLAKWDGFHPWPSVHGWRWIARDSKHELAPCIVRRNGRLLIDESRFIDLMVNKPVETLATTKRKAPARADRRSTAQNAAA